MRCILFLDHQGVMYTRKHPSPGILDDFDESAVNALNRILDIVPECEIVISSDWKRWVSLESMQTFYIGQDIKKAPIDYTPIKSGMKTYTDIAKFRADEICQWLGNKMINKWVAVDDLDMRPYLTNFVWITDIKRGLSCNEIEDKIIQALS